MVFAPSLDPLDVESAFEVVPVFRFSQPAALTVDFTRLSARRMRAEFLAAAVSGVGKKIIFAILTLTLSDLSPH
jgi:hypothetical protein